MKIYLVGGAVRDALLGLPVKERDYVVVGAGPEALLKLGYQPVGKSFPVFLHPKTNEEYALARTEKKTGKGYHGFSVQSSPDVTLEEDLLRRDLTINAIAQDETGQLIDPFHGVQDLKDRVLRHVSPAFAEDPVRLLRVARFLARFAPLGFHIHEDTKALLCQMVAEGEIDALVPERVWQECEKALNEVHPEQFFLVLHEVGALKILFPGFEAWFQEPAQSSSFKTEALRRCHLLEVIASKTPFPEYRFAAFLATHPKSYADQVKKIVTDLSKRLKIPKLYAETSLRLAENYHDLTEVASLSAEQVLALLERYRIFHGRTDFDKILSLSLMLKEAEGTLPEGDSLKIQHFWDELITFLLPITAANLEVTGKSGPELGAELRQARRAAIEKRLCLPF